MQGEEEVVFARAGGLSGVVTMHVERSPRLWKQFHETYTICNTLPSPGRWSEWTYRGKRHLAHDRLVTLLLEPGEVHCNLRIGGPLSFKTMFLAPHLVEAHARELGAACTPHFSLPQVEDQTTYRAISRLMECVRIPATSLELQSRLAHCLRLLLERHTERPGTRRARSERVVVLRVRRYLHERASENVTLDELVALTGLSRFHLLRVFTRDTGVAPHQFHLLARIERARTMLERGRSPAETAAELGFADQSHLGRHFRHVVGVPPGHYAAIARNRAIAF